MQWTKAAKARLLPYPGDAWTLDCDPKESAKRLVQHVGNVPDMPTHDSEVARGVVARLADRYGEDGNHPRDKLGSDLVDVWCARRGVVFALEVLIAIARTRPAKALAFGDTPYDIRWDGQPWGRLREHLFCSDVATFAEARALADAARKQRAGCLHFALAYAFCDGDWVAACLDDALEQGRGPLCVIAAIADPSAAAAVVRRMMDPGYRKYELIEESPQHLPNIMSRLGDDGASLVVEAARLAWNRASRRPWVDLVSCYDTAEARAFLDEFG